MKFENYELKDYIVRAIKDLKFTSFTEVQRSVMKEAFNKRNILAKSKTGSGKTHAFLIPIFQALDESLYKIQAVIVAPTKELAMQLYKVSQHIASFSPDRIDIRLYCGGTDREREIAKLNNSQPQIVIGTPGKIDDLAVKANALKIYTANTLVVDEMDMALESGFKDELDHIAGILKDSKMMFFSATMAEAIEPFVNKYLQNPVFIDIEDKEKTSNIDHIWIPLKYKDRFECLLDLLKNFNPFFCIIFANKKETVIDLAKKLGEAGYTVSTLHGDLSPRERRKVLNDCKNLRCQYLVATDLAARGIDIDGVSHIVQYELPYDYEFYVHRSGRTGRMNYTGIVYTLYEDVDDDYLDNLNKKKIKPRYFELKKGELVEYKGRNTRQARVKPKNEYELKASKMIPKSNKVKPGYKKKRQKEIEELAQKMSGKKKRRPRFYGGKY